MAGHTSTLTFATQRVENLLKSESDLRRCRGRRKMCCIDTPMHACNARDFVERRSSTEGVQISTDFHVGSFESHNLRDVVTSAWTLSIIQMGSGEEESGLAASSQVCYYLWQKQNDAVFALGDDDAFGK